MVAIKPLLSSTTSYGGYLIRIPLDGYNSCTTCAFIVIFDGRPAPKTDYDKENLLSLIV